MVGSRALKHSPLQPFGVELGGVCDRHHGHHSRLYRITDHQVGRVGNTAGHVQTDDEQTSLPDLAHGNFDVAAHQSAREN